MNRTPRSRHTSRFFELKASFVLHRAIGNTKKTTFRDPGQASYRKLAFPLGVLQVLPQFSFNSHSRKRTLQHGPGQSNTSGPPSTAKASRVVRGGWVGVKRSLWGRGEQGLVYESYMKDFSSILCLEDRVDSSVKAQKQTFSKLSFMRIAFRNIRRFFSENNISQK